MRNTSKRSATSLPETMPVAQDAREQFVDFAVLGEEAVRADIEAAALEGDRSGEAACC